MDFAIHTMLTVGLAGVMLLCVHLYKRIEAVEEDNRHRKTRQKFNEALHQHQSSFQPEQD